MCEYTTNVVDINTKTRQTFFGMFHKSMKRRDTKSGPYVLFYPLLHYQIGRIQLNVIFILERESSLMKIINLILAINLISGNTKKGFLRYFFE